MCYNIHMKTLIVVDMQNDFIDGSLGTTEAQSIVDNVVNKIKLYTEQNYNVIYTRDTHNDSIYFDTLEGKNLPVKHCIVNTDGWQIHKDVYIEGYPVINKISFGYYNWNTISEKYKILLDASDEIELIGLCTDICVISNAMILKALYPETIISIDVQCCAGVSPESHNRALETMKTCQINIKNFNK